MTYALAAHAPVAAMNSAAMPADVERHARDEEDADADHRPAEQLVARQLLLQREDDEDPDRGAGAERGQHHAVLRLGAEHLGGEHRAERDHRARADEAAAEPDDHGAAERLAAHEADAVLDLADARREVELLACRRVSASGSASRNTSTADTT